MAEVSKRRSRTMRAVKSKNTGPELAVRRLVREMGYGYRLHQAAVPCKPDLVFRGRRKIVFVHGCFWHGHDCSRGERVPKRNRDYWTQKIARNKERDRQCLSRLRADGWSVLTLWECEIKHTAELRSALGAFLGPTAQSR